MKVPTDGECVMQDLLRGEIRKEWATVDDQVILKSDGFPTYHLANVVDDHLMLVSHVIRGEEWINSLPKHLQLYEYFGWEPPVFCHLPLLRNNDANKTKLSKRKNPTSLNYYRRAGFLPEALRNFLGLMGWWPPDGEEKFDLEKMIASFELDKISLGGPVFDVEKLRWLNGRYIREDYDTPSLREALSRWALGGDMLDRILPLAQPRMETLSDWGYLTAFFFSDVVPYAVTDLDLKGKTADELKEVFQIAIWKLESETAFTGEAIENVFRGLAERFDVPLRDLSRPFYVAITGAKASTPLFQSMEILGLDLVRMRLRRAIESLGGLSSKRMKALEKDVGLVE
jgi:glutamyl-tRNA synthetase